MPEQESTTPTRPLIIYHANCTDGFAAAAAAMLSFDGDADTLAAAHTDLAPELDRIAGREVIIVDFAYASGIMRVFAEIASKFTWIDHHASTAALAEELRGLGLPNVTVVHDTNHSAAVLAWRILRQTPPPRVYEYIEDKDLGRYSLPDCRAITLGLQLRYDVYTDLFAIDSWRHIAWTAWQLAAEDGYPLFRLQEQHVRRTLKRAYKTGLFADTFPHLNVWAVNTDLDFDAVGAAICEELGADVAIMYSANADLTYKVGFRSMNGTNCIPLAATRGGGGHERSSGCTLWVPPPVYSEPLHNTKAAANRRKMAEEGAKEEKEHLTAIKAWFELNPELKHVVVSYSGSGDSGGVDHIFARSESDEAMHACTDQRIPVRQKRHHYNYETQEITVEVEESEIAASELVRDYVELLFSRLWISFDNDGSQGELVIDRDGRVTMSHSDLYMESTEYEHHLAESWEPMEEVNASI